jgi:hypothetical protein
VLVLRAPGQGGNGAGVGGEDGGGVVTGQGRARLVTAPALDSLGSSGAVPQEQAESHVHVIIGRLLI